MLYTPWWSLPLESEYVQFNSAKGLVLDMQPAVRLCLPTAAVLGPFCRGCLGRAQRFPGGSFRTSPRQMSRWNSCETCSPPPPQENPRVLITGNTNIYLSLTHIRFWLRFRSEQMKLTLFSVSLCIYSCPQSSNKRGWVPCSSVP